VENMGDTITRIKGVRQAQTRWGIRTFIDLETESLQLNRTSEDKLTQAYGPNWEAWQGEAVRVVKNLERKNRYDPGIIIYPYPEKVNVERGEIILSKEEEEAYEKLKNEGKESVKENSSKQILDAMLEARLDIIESQLASIEKLLTAIRKMNEKV